MNQTSNIEAVITSMKLYFGDGSNQIPHTLKVLDYARQIYHGERIDNLNIIQIIELASVLHDIGVPEAMRKYGASWPIYQEEEGPIIAKNILKQHNFRDSIVERVCYIVGHHHTIKAIDGIDFQILWEADFLVNIEEEWINADTSNNDKVIEQNFKTATGRKLVEQVLIDHS